MIKLNPKDIQPGKPEIIFPVEWSYRAVVDATVADTLENLNKVLEKYQYSERFAIGNTSGNQRYKSFHVTVTVPNREVMNKLGKEFGEVKGVKFVL
ncbi:MAG: DUF493 family protein [Lentisphaeria bacterium]|nr:DUF493 domain-containing protein [Lentisphaerota bacterium]MBR7144831.1 DUF493 family protein [Lentisphaeria bacterium]